jgi:hypothetical protein
MGPLIARYSVENISSTTDIAVIDTYYHGYLSYQANFVGTLQGTLKLFLSNDGANYAEYTRAAQTIPAGNDTYIVDLVVPCLARYFKIVMDVTSGTGDIDLIASLKGDT